MPSPDFWEPAPELQREQISFEFEDNEFLGHLVAPPPTLGPRPLILVIHNYQGLKFFEVDVAEYFGLTPEKIFNKIINRIQDNEKI